MNQKGAIALVSMLILTGGLYQAQAFPHQVGADTVQTTETIQPTINWEAEKAKALAAGYTEEQFEQIMAIPDLPSEQISPDNIIFLPPQKGNRATDSLLAKQQAVVTWARNQLGKPYKSEAAGPDSFDCSGLVQYVYKNAVNISLPHYTVSLESYGTEVSMNSLQPGDLLFFGDKGKSYHVAIYIGNNQFIQAPKPGDVVKITDIKYFTPNFARRILKDTLSTAGQATNEQYIFRVYNPNSGLHHYTGNANEAIQLQNSGWSYEGVGWVAPSTGSAVYRVYNPNSGQHHYTMSAGERDSLVKAGWKNEGTAWNSGGSLAVYRVYNSKSGEHHYTTSAGEKNNLVTAGWAYEGVAWYAVRNVS